MASAFYESSVLFAASDLGVFEGLARIGSADAGVLAAELKCDERGMRLLLDACVALELLKKDNSK